MITGLHLFFCLFIFLFQTFYDTFTNSSTFVVSAEAVVATLMIVFYFKIIS
jgi:hypothetical protein